MDNMLTDYHGELNIEELLTNSDVDAHVQLFDDNDDHDSKEMFRILASRGRMMALDIGHGKLKEGTKFKVSFYFIFLFTSSFSLFIYLFV